MRLAAAAGNASSSSFSGVDEDDLDRCPTRCARSARGFLIFGERRVERDDVGDAALAQHVELIFHQRDQRADDDRRSLEQQRRQLIGQALARARCENCQRIFAVKTRETTSS